MKIGIPWAKPYFRGKERKYLTSALESTWISSGYYVEKFEEEFTQFLGLQYGLTTSNGTTALQLALLGLDIGVGDEVIIPGFTFVAPINMVIGVGATPVYADIDPLTWCISPSSVKECITSKTKAIIPVHIYGNVCDMDKLVNLKEKYHLYIIEDVAEACLSRYQGKYAGTFGDLGCFSFHATKTITMGEGGFVITDSKKLYEKMRVIRDHGMRKDKRYWHDSLGYNFRITNLQAAVGYGQLENIDKIISERQRVYGIYNSHLVNEPGITVQNFLPEVDPVFWTIAVKIDPNLFKGNRDFLIKSLLKVGIETRPGFYPFSIMPIYNAPSLPVSEDTGSNIICLPFFPSLTEEEIVFICNHLKRLKR